MDCKDLIFQRTVADDEALSWETVYHDIISPKTENRWIFYDTPTNSLAKKVLFPDTLLTVHN